MKKRDKCSECLLHEFNIGCKLNTLNNPHLIKYLAYIECPCEFYKDKSSFILMEYVEGEPLHKLDVKLSFEENALLYKHIILILADIQSNIQFTHYDLHSNNIIVNISDMKFYEYNCFNTRYLIRSPYEIKLIDFGSSHVKGVNNTWVDINIASMENGIIPSIYDDFYDLSTIICNFIYICIYERQSFSNKYRIYIK